MSTRTTDAHPELLPKDNDSGRRSCTVSLYRKPIVAPLCYHWSLHFDWGNHDVYYEADDVNGILMPSCGRGKPEMKCGSLVMCIGSGEFSPNEVNKAAQRNKFNGKTYVLTKMNSQIWAQELASLLNLSISIPCHVISNVAPGLSNVVDQVHEVGKMLLQGGVWNQLGGLMNLTPNRGTN